ncbi:MAG: lipid-A-disaccharide synthase [Capsulimonadaceae bacterium]
MAKAASPTTTDAAAGSEGPATIDAAAAPGSPMKVAIVAGEASGDRQGAALIQALRERVSPRPVVAWGCGGAMMRAAGVDIKHDCSPYGSIGVAATLVNLPVLVSVQADMKRMIAADPPDVLVLIDAGAFCVPLARWAKTRNLCPVFYYFPPSSWRRSPRPPRRGQSSLADVTDTIVTPFPWSADFLTSTGANAHFVGHPLLDLIKREVSDDQFYGRYGLDPQRPLVALMPGSRRFEVKYILPALIGAAGEISRRVSGVQFAIALAPTVPRDFVEAIIRSEQRSGGRAARLQLLITQAGGKLAQIAHSTLTPGVVQLSTPEGLTLPAPPDQETPILRERPTGTSYAPLVICEGHTYDVIGRSDLVITKSGTSTLEAAILKRPMIIVYRGNALMKAEWMVRRRSLNISFIGMPNILAREEVFPELIQDDANPEAIADIAVGILLQPDRMLTLKNRIAEVVRETLGEPGGVRRAADLLFDLVEHGVRKPVV